MLEDRVELGVRVLGLGLEDLDLAEELFRALDLARVAARLHSYLEIFQESKRDRFRDFWLVGTGTDGVQRFKINAETAIRAASDDAILITRQLPVPVNPF